MSEKKWYDNEISMGIMTRKYLHEGEKPEEFIPRLVSIFSDDIKDDAYTLVDNAWFLPAGRTLFGAGYKGERKVSLSNCFCMPSPKDDLESIFDTARDMARIFSYGGGAGLAIDNLRPKGAKVNNSALESSGAVSFLNVFDNVGSVIGQNGRRAAIMVVLTCEHPDIYEYLRVKQNNEKLASMNISIKFTNKFMEAVEQNRDFELHFESPETGKITNVINAKEFFDEFCNCNLNWGDPGLIFIDRVRQLHLLSGYENYRIETSNPCLAGYVRILTDRGYFPIASLVGQEVNVWNGYRWSKVIPNITGTDQPMLRIYFSNGTMIDCTDYHKFIMKDGTRKEAKDLLIGEKLIKWNLPQIEGINNIDRKTMYTHGFFSGDGSMINNSVTPAIILYEGKKSLVENFNYDRINEHSTSNRAGGTRLCVILAKDQIIPYDKNWIPDTSFSVQSRLDWLAGLIDSDGTMVSVEGGIGISSINYQFLHNVQLMLTTLGAPSTIAIVKNAGYELMPTNNGTGDEKEYYHKTCYRLTISPFYVTILKRMGLITSRVTLVANADISCARYVKVTHIERISNAQTVYCLNEPFNHSFVAEGVLVGNCSEVFGIGGTSCNLGSVNLYEMIDDKFTDHAHFNYDRFKYVVHYATCMLDEVLDYGLDMQPLELNKQTIRDWRPIGLGIFGMADAFVALGIKYGSEESRHLMSDIMEAYMKQALITSIELAKKKGPFGKFDAEKSLKAIQIQAYPELHEGIKKYGIRNGALLSIAPTGTISLFAGKYTGGIEPMFKICYERTSHSMEDSGKTFRVYARGVEDLLKFHNLEDISPEEAKKRFPFLIESHEVPYLDRVRLQGIVQEYVDNAISSTVNLPHDATEDQIREIFMEAWKQGLKGITVFVDGCKRGNILGVEKKKDDEEKVTNVPEGCVPAYDSIDAPSRRNTKYVEGATVRVRTSCARSMYVTVNKTEDGNIFEVFTNASGGCQANINTITRMISLSLRSGVKLNRVLDELRNNQCPACQLLRRNGELDVSLSCSNAIADAIEMVMKRNGSEIIEDDTIKKSCPECGKKTLIPEGKCVTCSNCGWSKCE